MKLKKTAAIFLTVAAAAGAIGIGATSASAAPLPVTVHSQQVDSTPTMPTSAESWKILGIDLIYDGKTMGAPSPDVREPPTSRCSGELASCVALSTTS